MKYSKGIVFVLLALGSATVATLVMAASPTESGYSSVPKKRNALGAEASTVRDESVRPEEAFKYGVQEFAVIAGDTGYFPSRIIVRKNIPVKLFLTSSSSRPLCFVMDEFSIRKGVATQAMEEIRFLPTKAGQYKFYCPVGEIQGSITVRD